MFCASVCTYVFFTIPVECDWSRRNGAETFVHTATVITGDDSVHTLNGGDVFVCMCVFVYMYTLYLMCTRFL